ncbi:MAG: YifB family Mg chelatase-like AAA ATPase [Eubacteriales bacterium]|nr:YifB family Mg chelatase-like AAA ATPase [Eubacteriales bacterium]
MVTTVQSAGLYGVDGYLVTVECEMASGLPAFDLVGLPGMAVKESRERVRAAARACGLPLSPCHITVNLAPADIRKEGAVYDLPILLGLLHAQDSCPEIPKDCVCIGELSLAGKLRPVKGALSMALAARDAGMKSILLPEENAAEAALAGDIAIYAAGSIQEIMDHLKGDICLKPYQLLEKQKPEDRTGLDFSEVLGQENVKRAMEIAAAGGHNILLSGSPGSGKSMMAKRISTILPPMSEEEKREVVRVYSAIGEGMEAVRRQDRPVRSPHHTTSPVGLAGGGTGIPRPGEVSLAHNGVLFLDELPEFSKDALEILRQPMEDGVVSIVRSAGRVIYPADFMLVCAMNPCKCGWYGHASGRCHCTPQEVARYRRRISGPLLDRIDLQIAVQPVPLESLVGRRPAEPSSVIRERVVAARERQSLRYRGTSIRCNAQMNAAQLAQYGQPDAAGQRLLNAAFARMGMTARSYDRVLRVARTIADLDGADRISVMHIAEAVQYRFPENI